MKAIKGKKLIVISVGVVVIIILGISIFVLSTRQSQPKSPSAQANQQPGTEIQAIPTITPKEIGLTLTMGSDGKRVIMEIANTKEIQSIDYELDYTSSGGISRGTMGHNDVKNAQPIKQEIVLGTCSDVCHYDQDVSNIKLVVKVTKTDGNVYQAQVTLE